MFAGDIYGPKKIRLVDVEEPVLHRPAEGESGQILFQPELGCLCGSDMILFEGDYKTFDLAVGHSLHELVGTVIDTTGTRFKPGERVLCVPDYQLGLFERFVVSETRAIPLDLRKPEEQMLMSQPLGTVLFALRKLANVIDLNVAVVGQGPIGLLFTAALRNLGARHIIALDRVPQRLEASRSMGATEVVDVTEGNAIETVREVTDGQMADLVVEAVGHREIDLGFCIELCRDAGQILGFGLTDETLPKIPWLAMHLKNINIQMSLNPDFDRDFPLAMRWIGEERIDVTPIITHRYPVDQIQAAYDLFFSRRDGAIKVLVEFPRAS